MNTDTQSGQISDQDQPAVAVGLVGYIFPFQNQPEYNGCKEGGESIYFAFYGREPEGVAEGVDQCADQSATHDSDKLSFRDVALVVITSLRTRWVMLQKRNRIQAPLISALM